MHAIHRPKFIIKIGEHFFPDEPIHKQTVKFISLNLKEKSMRYALFPKNKH